MKNLFIILLGFTVGLLATGFYLEYRMVKEPEINRETAKTGPPSFSIDTPPSVTLKGKMLSRTGKILWESRTATAPAEIAGLTELSQGERVVTEQDSEATLEFERFGKITMGKEADISFPQTLPTDFVVNQRKGKVTYEMAGAVPLSIRMRTALVIKQEGKIEIEITPDDPIILISTLEGTATIGFNDTENVSQVFNLREGQIYEYDSDERTAINQNLK